MFCVRKPNHMYSRFMEVITRIHIELGNNDKFVTLIRTIQIFILNTANR
jgi:hypothetical protein